MQFWLAPRQPLSLIFIIRYPAVIPLNQNKPQEHVEFESLEIRGLEQMEKLLSSLMKDEEV